MKAGLEVVSSLSFEDESYGFAFALNTLSHGRPCRTQSGGGGELGVDTDDSAAMHYIGAKYSQRWLYQLPMSVISTSCETVYTTKERKTGLGRDKQEFLCHYP